MKKVFKKGWGLFVTMVLIAGLFPMSTMAEGVFSGNTNDLQQNQSDVEVPMADENGAVMMVAAPAGETALPMTNVSMKNPVESPTANPLLSEDIKSLAVEGDFEFAPIPGGVSITHYTGSGGEVRIPGTLGGLPVLQIGDRAFRSCDSLTSITIPEGVTRIGFFAFDQCRNLKTAIFPGSLKSIDRLAFQSCHNLTSVTLPEGITSLGEQVFSGCRELVSIHIPSSVISIEPGILMQCDKLMDISVSADNPTYTSHNGILFDKSLSTLIQCPGGKTSITIPASVITIEKYAFYGNSKLTKIDIPDTVTAIGDQAFNQCSLFTSITLSKNIARLGANPFSGCRQLMAINIDETNANYTSLNGVLYNKNKTTLIGFPGGKTSIPIPESVTTIGDYAFSGCDTLTSIVIPQGVTSIGHLAFWGCHNLTTIDISKSVTSLGRQALSYCPKLTKVIMRANTIHFEYSMFLGSPLVTIYGIPGSDSETYAKTNNIPFIDLNHIPSIATLQSIAITAPATKLTYQVGETLDLTGLVVTGTYSDGTSKVETLTSDNVTGFNSSATAANQVLTITIGGKTATYTVKIVAGEEPEKGEFTGFLGQDSAGNYYLYNKADFNNSYLAYQINPSLSGAKMYRHYMNQPCRIVALKDLTRGYMDYSATASASLSAQLRGETFDINAYFGRSDAKIYEAAVTLVGIVDKDGNVTY